MIWQSIPLMTSIDLVILLGASYLIFLLRRHLQPAKQLGLVRVLNFIIGGLVITSLFYAADLFVMHGLPLISSKEHAMETMMALHLNVHWFITLASVALIVGGVSYLLRSLIPRTASLTETLQEKFKAGQAELKSMITTLEQEISDRNKAEKELQEQLEKERVTGEIGSIFQKTDDLNQALDQAVQLIAVLFKVDFCEVLLQKKGGEFGLAAGFGWKEGLVNHVTVPADPGSLAGYTLKINAPVIVEDFNREKRFSGPSLLTDHGIVSGLTVPMDSRGRAIGVLGIHSTRNQSFTLQEGHSLQNISNLIAASIERKRAEEAVREAHAHLEMRVRERTIELEKGNAVLKHEIAERKKAEAALQEKQEGLRLLLESTEVVPWEADPKTFQFTYVGPQALNLLGFPVERWYEPDFWPERIHPEDRKSAVELCLKSFKQKTNFEFEYRMITSDSRVIWVHDKVHVVMSNGAPSLLRGFLIDITGRKKAEEALKREIGFAKLLQKIVGGSNQAGSISEAIQMTIDSICRHTGWPVGHAYLLDESEKDLYPSKIWHLDHPQKFEAFRKITEKTRFAAGFGLPGRILTHGRAAWITDVTRDPNFPRARGARDIGIHAALGFPVFIGDKVVAVLEFFSEKLKEPDADLLVVMDHIGAQLGRVIERKQLESKMKTSS